MDNIVEEQPQVPGGNQDDEGIEIKTVRQAIRRNKPLELKRLIEEGNPLMDHDFRGWTAMHHAAFLGRTKCLRILLNAAGPGVDETAAFDASTPLMAACSNLPTSKKCIRLLCEHRADQRMTNHRGFTALHAALRRKPDLEVIHLLVQSGAPVNNPSKFLMLYLLNGDGRRMVTHPEYAVDVNPEQLETDETEVAEIAMYLARKGVVNYSLRALLTFRGRITTLQVLDNLVDCFLEEGAVLDQNADSLRDHYWGASILAILVKKSIVFLEGIQTPLETGTYRFLYVLRHNTILGLLFKGMASGILSLTTVKKVHDRLMLELGNDLPPDFGPLEALYAMTRNPPSLSQLARTKIRAQVAKCGKFNRNNLKKLPLTHIMIDFVQLNDLGDGKKLEDMMRAAVPILMLAAP